VTQDSGITGIAHVIQLSVAPVFLLSGIGAMLAVMTNRLARVIDRARALEAKATADPPGRNRSPRNSTPSWRARHISRAITLCTITALLVCGVIATLFLGAFFGFDASGPAALLFVTAMLAFMAGLLLFVREVLRATANLRIGRHPTRE
jgi:Protein of unknown function (DUF2721).